MSDATKSKFTFVVYAPDNTDPEAYSRRMAVRQQHLDNAKSLKQQGIVKIGGGLLTPETYQTANKKLIGSMLIYEMESLEAVRDLVESDVYWTNNVWDKEKVAILPFLPAAPLPA